MRYFLSVFLGTYILEDVALSSAIGFIAQGKLSAVEGFLACFLGISSGDVVLYLVGAVVSYFKINTRLVKSIRHSSTLTSAIIISRFVPGTRLPTYLAAGYLRYPFVQFLILTLVTVFAWVILAMQMGRSLQFVFMDHWILSFVLFLLALHVSKLVITRLIDPWKRRALLHTWRKWLQFEFWPAGLFYLPIVPYYVYLSIKYKNIWMPFYASPALEHVT